MEITQASHEWATRPEDQRFASLDDLHASVDRRRNESWTRQLKTQGVRVNFDSDGAILAEVYDPSRGEKRNLRPSNWAFGQLAQYAGAPAAYLRKLPPQLTTINLQYGLDAAPLREDALLLARSNGDNVLRALTSPSYGRIWDIDVVKAVQRANAGGQWEIPSASYQVRNPKRATTLYASDRDVFIFLVDPKHPIEVNGETLFRGFITWNSEVGAATFGLTTFLYRYVCDNRIIWGATNVKELKIRHIGGAPERFAGEGARYLARYAEESTAATVETIKKAQAFEIPAPDAKGAGWEKWLVDRGFTTTQARQSISSAQAEEGETRSLWNIINGVTAYARTIPFTDERVKVETQAGKLLDRLG